MVVLTGTRVIVFFAISLHGIMNKTCVLYKPASCLSQMISAIGSENNDPHVSDEGIYKSGKLDAFFVHPKNGSRCIKILD